MFKFTGTYSDLENAGFEKSKNLVMVRYMKRISDRTRIVVFDKNNRAGNKDSEIAYNHITTDAFNKKWYGNENHKYIISDVFYVEVNSSPGFEPLDELWIIEDLILKGLVVNIPEEKMQDGK